ncbi:MAG TPA: FG-GAP-like repeat-containing protein, partial [bacterium]|nr:FG-GAP-like repeat-containing protein [bacterium]
LNDGAGNFSGPSVAVGSGPYAVQSADIDGDGDLDLVVANANSNNVSVLINDGAANFTGGATVSVQTTPYDIVAGDFDSDGDMDFATANVGANSISVRLNDGAGNFPIASDPAVGTNPQGIQAADLDGDGDIDILTANVGSNDASVMLNDGSGNFFGGQTPTVGAFPYSIIASDLDGDGDVDFATADWNANTVSVRYNDGAANFSGSTAISVGSQPYDIAAADLDGDGSIDLITPNAGSNDVSIAFNDAILPSPSGLYAVAQNGQVELNWSAAPGATLYRIYHDVNPNPMVQTDSSVGTNKTIAGLVNGTLYFFRIKAINATDESGYSNEDAAVPVAGAGQALSLEGIDDEAAIFTSYQNLGVDPSSVTISAWVKPNGTSPSISTIYEGQGIILDAGGYLGLTRGDYTGQDRIWAYLWDGSQIFVGIPYTNGVWTHVAVVLRNGQLYAYKNGVVVDSAVSGNVQNITSGSIDVGVNPYNSLHFEGQIDEMRIWNRGLMDAEMASVQASPSRGDEAGLLANWHFDEGSGSTTFDASPNNRNLTLFNGPTYVVSGAMAPPLSIVSTTPSANGLSIPANSNIIVNFTSDILTDSLNSRNILIRGAQSGDHTFTYGYGAQTANIDPNTDFIPGELVTVTLTRGILAISSDTLKPYSWQFYVQTNLATGFFSAGDTVVVGTFPKAIAAADFNNDGSLDMAVVNQSTNDVSIAINDGSGGFTVLSNVAVGSLPYEIASADFDGDGDLDIAVSNNSSSDISIRSNDGSGNFGVLANISTGVAQLTVAAGDFDGDGDVDLISSESGTQLRVRLNDGTGSAFSPGNVINVQNNPYFITVADFDNDGDLDLTASNYSSGTFSVRLNDGTGLFGAGGDFTTNGIQPRAIRAADFNGDGLMDIAFCNENSGNVGIRLNDGVGGFSGNEIGVGSLPQSITLGDFEGDGDMDVAAVNYGSTNVQTIVNDGAGNFVAGSSYGTGNGGVILSSGNFSGTATMEIAAADNTANVIYVLKNAVILPTTTLVTSKGDGGSGSLRDAIDYANSHAGPDTIIFNVSVDSVLLASQLPDITDDSLFINGDFNSDNIPDVVIDGINNGINEAFVRVAANDITIKGLTIIRFVQGSEAALTISNAARRAKILYNYIGTDGTALYSNVNNIDILAPAGGGQHEIRGNVISARGYGIFFYGSSNDLDSTKIVDNKIGTNAAGSAPLTYAPSHLSGIYIQNGRGLKIHSNIISGWSGAGALAINFGYTGFSYYAKEVEIFDNKIGTDFSGTAAIPNERGIYFDAGSNANFIGKPGLGNIISGNTGNGIEIWSDSNVIEDNFIGVDISGNAPLANVGMGIQLQNASVNTIGNGNTISGNANHGIFIFSNGGLADENTIINNNIGVGADGVTPVGNNQMGVRIYSLLGARRNLLLDNAIAFNNFHGIEMDGSASADSMIAHGNRIYSNNLGGMNYVAGSNGSITPPMISFMSMDSVVHGTSDPNAFVQIYVDSTNQGRLRIGTGVADGAGNFAVPVTLLGGEAPFLTALQSSTGRTSGFSVPISLTLSDLSVVNSLADDGSPGTLRAAIDYANSHVGPDTIRFDISLLGQTINMNSNLPDITDDYMVINGDVDGDNIGDVQLFGLDPTADKGLNILSSYNEIRNLRITDFYNNSSGIDIDGGNYNIITGCYVDDNEVGIHIKNGGRGNRIGDGTIQGRNYIFNNTYNGSPGIIIEHVGSDSNIVAGNFIGTEDGVTPSGNGTDGVIVRLGAKYNRIGDANAQIYNVISANTNHGILIESDSNMVVRNLIGTDSTGTVAMGNQGYGIHILNAVGNMIGDGTLAGRNIISNNSSNVLNGAGIMVENSSGTSILGNFVGTDITGLAAMPNWSGGGAGSGVTLDNSSYNVVGDGTDAGRNVFGNNGSGADFPVQIYIQNNSNYNLVAGNYVGTDSTGTSSLGTGNGIGVYGSVNNQIGLNAGAAANVIAGNGGDGIILNNADSTKVFQNYIGVDRTGATALPNNNGIVLENGTQNALIGNNTGSGGNIVSGNSNQGIRIQDVGTDSNLIIGNLIGTDLSGSTAIPNGNDGIQIDGGSANQVGEIGSGNVISGNSGNGIAIIGNTGISAYNVVLHNLIGVAIDSVTALGNAGNGVFIAGISTFAHNNEITRNRIAYNTNFGITADQTGFQVDSDHFFANEIYSNG